MTTKIVEATKPTRSQEIAGEVRALLQARNPLIWIEAREESRVEGFLFQAAIAAKYQPYTWDVGQGVVKGFTGKPDESLCDPEAALGNIRKYALQEINENKQRGVWIMRDLPGWLTGVGALKTLRVLRNLVRLLPGIQRDTAQSIIVISPDGNVPPELADHATVIRWPMPDRNEIAVLLDTAVKGQREPIKLSAATREAAIDAAVGLSGEEANACFAKSLVSKRIDPKMIAQEKKRVITRSGLIEWYDPIPEGLDAVGGLDVLKAWLVERRLALSADARKYGLPFPKGVLLAGISGCGKSWTAKATATAFSMPLLRVDLGALKAKFVGDSEQNLRRVFELIKTINRCVVWLDEIEKSLAGATQGAADGGVSADALGAILSWMQERQGEAFVIATANDITSITKNAPELLRKGRFDEIFFVDLPNATERIEILKVALKANGREALKIDHAKVTAACYKFTGSEIAALVPDALFAAFADGMRQPTTADLIKAARNVTPLSKTAGPKIKELRDWAIEQGNARLATSRATTRVNNQSGIREVDAEEEA